MRWQQSGRLHTRGDKNQPVSLLSVTPTETGIINQGLLLSVVPAKAGTNASNERRIPACAENTPQKRPSYYTEILGGLGQKGSGGNDRVEGARVGE